MSSEQRLFRQINSSRQSRQAAYDRALHSPVNMEIVDDTFRPFYAMLNQLENDGTIDMATGDIPVVFVPLEEAWVPVIPAVEGIIRTYTLYAQENGIEPQCDGLRRLTRKLELMMPLMVPDVVAARASMDWMRQTSITMTPAHFRRYADELQAESPVGDEGPIRMQVIAGNDAHAAAA